MVFIALAVTRKPLDSFFCGSVGSKWIFENVELYKKFADKILDGKKPYRDFECEYPLLSLPFFVLPRLLADDRRGYILLFVIEMFAADAVAVGLVTHHLESTGLKSEVLRRLLWYSACIMVLSPLTACRFDLLVMAWTFATAIALTAEHSALGGLLAGLGVLVKMVPGLVLLPALASRKEVRKRAMAVFATTLGLGMAAWLAVGGWKVADAFLYHTERGLEIGSIYAGAVMATARSLEVSIAIRFLHKSYEVETPWSSSVGALGFPLQSIAIALVTWRAWRVGKDEPLRYMGAAVLGFVTFGKVLSPQYLIWLIPFLACVEGWTGQRGRILLLASCVATTLIYPIWIVPLLACDVSVIAILNVRNAMLVILWLVLTFGPAAATPGRTAPAVES